MYLDLLSQIIDLTIKKDLWALIFSWWFLRPKILQDFAKILQNIYCHDFNLLSLHYEVNARSHELDDNTRPQL